MHHYPHHIGDFDRATRHLTRIERSIYRDLLDVYYDTEHMLTLDRAALCRKVLAKTAEEVDAVGTVLAEFFHETPNGWWSDRCEFELDSYRKSTTQKSTAGKASAAARAAKREQAINGNSTVVVTAVERTCNGTPTNQEPRTNNQEPITKKDKAPPAGDAELFPDVDPQVVSDFKALRKLKKAPVTKTAMEKIAAEAMKAGLSLEAALRVCCSRGWQGFNAEWMAPRAGGNQPAGQINEKFHVAHLDHSSSNAAMAASMKKHNIVTPEDGDIPF
jgi:uncharacterized protein YdaU (DUF1376 family)